MLTNGNGNCRDRSDLDNSQTYSREKCNNGWCAVMYASYFEKDQTMDGPSTHLFRLANGNDDPPENHYGRWRYPAA